MRGHLSTLAVAALTASSPVEAQKPRIATAPQRKVVLMDFTRVPLPETRLEPVSTANDQPITEVARQMASAFTNSSPASLMIPEDVYSPPVLTPASLRNPFLNRAFATSRSMPVPAFNAGGSCDRPEYRPDYSHGQTVEARRRLIFPLVHQAACEQGLPVGLFDALIMQESRYNHLAVSPKGAFGLAQLMPGTARQLGTNPYAVMENLRGGARYLRQQIDRFGRYDLALAAYNSGPERVAKLGRVPFIAETTDYVRRISANWTGTVPQDVLIGPRTARRASIVLMPYYERMHTN